MRLHAQRLVASCAVACGALVFGGDLFGGIFGDISSGARAGSAFIRTIGLGGIGTAAAQNLRGPINDSRQHLPLRLGTGRGNGHRAVRSQKARSARAVASKQKRRKLSSSRSSRDESATGALGISEDERRLFGLTRTWPNSSSSSLPSPVLEKRTSIRSSGLPLSVTSPLWSHRAVRNEDLRGLSLPNLPVRLEERTLRYLKFYRDSARGRRVARSWVKKSGRYTPIIIAALAKAGLPTDLVWMSLIESGHNPTIRSPVGAAGLWQFMPNSARAHGLKVNRWVDERLDPVRATQAAIQYLTKLKKRFGTWELAMAAYNMGHSGLSRVIRKYNSNDFWQLARLEAALPWETTLYVPKVLAVATLMRNRRAFGLAKIARDPVIGFETVYVSPGISLAKVAKYAGISPSRLRSMNPQFLGRRTPPKGRKGNRGSWAVYVPRGQAAQTRTQLAALAPSTLRPTVEVRQGDTWASIAHRTGSTERLLSTMNGMRRDERLSAGSVLLRPLPSKGRLEKLLEDREPHVVISRPPFFYRDRQRVFYRATSGNVLQQVAEAFRVSPSDLRLWNDLDPRAVLQSGMVLQVFVPRNAKLPKIRFARENNAGKQLRVGSNAFFSHFESAKGRRRLQIQSRAGDTLYSIGKRYGVSGGMMARINHRPQRQRLIPGSPVVVYARYGPVPQEILLSMAPSPLPPAIPPHPASLPLAPHSQLTPH